MFVPNKKNQFVKQFHKIGAILCNWLFQVWRVFNGKFRYEPETAIYKIFFKNYEEEDFT